MRGSTTHPTAKLTLRMPAALIERARRQAGITRRSLNRFIVDAIERQIAQAESICLSENETVQVALEQSGLLVRPNVQWNDLLSGRPLKTHTEILEAMSGQRPLSEDIIEMRGEI
ncbi:MAG: hypothetical protein WHX53_02265 [Anaerolineae bacterium]